MTLKVISILHRAMQEEKISQIVAHKVKEKEMSLTPVRNGQEDD